MWPFFLSCVFFVFVVLFCDKLNKSETRIDLNLRRFFKVGFLAITYILARGSCFPEEKREPDSHLFSCNSRAASLRMKRVTLRSKST